MGVGDGIVLPSKQFPSTPKPGAGLRGCQGRLEEDATASKRHSSFTETAHKQRTEAQSLQGAHALCKQHTNNLQHRQQTTDSSKPIHQTRSHSRRQQPTSISTYSSKYATYMATAAAREPPPSFRTSAQGTVTDDYALRVLILSSLDVHGLTTPSMVVISWLSYSLLRRLRLSQGLQGS